MRRDKSVLISAYLDGVLYECERWNGELRQVGSQKHRLRTQVQVGRVNSVLWRHVYMWRSRDDPRIVAIEICQGTFQISRKINFSIWDQICPTLDYFQSTRNVRIRIQAYSEIMIPSRKFSNTNTPGHWTFFPTGDYLVCLASWIRIDQLRRVGP